MKRNRATEFTGVHGEIKKKNKKQQKRVRTTLASGLGVVKRKKKMNSVGLVSRQNMFEKKEIRKIRKTNKKSAQPWRADWRLCK